MFDFENFPIKLSGKNVDYICPKCKYDKCVSIDYKFRRGYHHVYKDNK